MMGSAPRAVSAVPPIPSSPSVVSDLSYLSSLLASRQPGYSMPSPFYLDPLVYAYDLKLMWRRAWLFAGYTIQVPNAGDYFTYEIGDDSIIIMRSSASTDPAGITTSTDIRAFQNTCRHRGSRIVPATKSTVHTKRLVCPYHQWGYERDGSLVHVRDMDPTFDKSSNGLHEVHVEEVEGMIFVCLTPKGEKPMWEFNQARQLMAPQLAPHELHNAKIAHTETYTIKANWKLVYENNREVRERTHVRGVRNSCAKMRARCEGLTRAGQHDELTHFLFLCPTAVLPLRRRPSGVHQEQLRSAPHVQGERAGTDGARPRSDEELTEDTKMSESNWHTPLTHNTCFLFVLVSSLTLPDPHYPGKEKVLSFINARTAEWESLGFKCSPDSSFPGDGWYRASRMVRGGRRRFDDFVKRACHDRHHLN